MIYHKGYQRPFRDQLLAVKKVADASFTQVVDLSGELPCPPGYEFYRGEVIALTMSYVEPHQDPWVSMGEEPSSRRAVFWVMGMAGHPCGPPVKLHAGTMSELMYAGAWVMFDDSVMHSVFSSRKWWGLAYQLRPT